jgi:hypothetical protein
LLTDPGGGRACDSTAPLLQLHVVKIVSEDRLDV